MLSEMDGCVKRVKKLSRYQFSGDVLFLQNADMKKGVVCEVVHRKGGRRVESVGVGG
jgi:hypothetical protein